MVVLHKVCSFSNVKHIVVSTLSVGPTLPDLQLVFGFINQIYVILSQNPICLNLRAFGCTNLAQFAPCKKKQISGMLNALCYIAMFI